MKIQIGALILALFLFSSASFGQVVMPTTLAATMKQMQKHLKLIEAQSTDASKNKSSVQLSTEFVTLSAHARDFAADAVPASVPNRTERMALFQKLIDEVAVTGQMLAQAFAENDNVKAAAILETLAEMRRHGHSVF